MTQRLAGKRILIVEDEQMLIDYLADGMVAEGAEVIEPVAIVNAALDVIANTPLDGVTSSILSLRAK
jgi:DNA-binding response OmpR family regulator